ncbi:Predicted arabinose efflux permease, MFS family [Catalinimonas alkaloidigena]|uniref:Predicted arabinose efflux permease, MFS family n=1 Tax=Catalinimonas alkaloidigena TaxID=1075417 RepID=A0A1G9S5S2_9BACT|nr:MFS transporter [Catalinimonas alkaloidigena]SDM30650.1 Predicted arabinose efflux permease, MFS family [Catalinimonas alkaloidigena]
MPSSTPRIYTVQFWLLCTSSFLFFASFNLIIPELPAYLARLGGEQYIGLIIALFTLTAGLSRPFSGKLADTWGRIPVMVLGAVVCFFCGFLYPLLTTVGGFLFLRFFHGFSTGFKPTGTSAYVADLVPTDRRGEAMGISSLCGSLGMACGPAVGGWIALHFGLNVMFYTSSAFAILSVLILAGMRETLSQAQPFRLRMLRIGRHEVFEPQALPPALVLLLTSFSYGVVLTLIPDLSVHVGIENKGLFFTSFTAASLAVRILAGKVSDRWGRVIVLKAAGLSIAGAMFFIGLAETKMTLLLASLLLGAGLGMNSPTITAWTIDRAHDRHRGRALATMYIALEAGIGVGALVSGWLYGGEATGFRPAFWLAAGLASLAFVFLVFWQRQQRGLRSTQSQ